MAGDEAAVLGDTRQHWLVGSGGLYWSGDTATWQTSGDYQFRVTSLVRQQDRVCVGTTCGVWAVQADSARWIQLNDETVTEVLDLAVVSGDPGVVVASAYGLAVGCRDELGAVRWAERTAGLEVRERYANAIAIDPADPGRWLVGTEAGVLVAEDDARKWSHTGLLGTPVRTIVHRLGSWWAGTDTRGMWQSRDGLSWRRAGRGLDSGTVVSLGEAGGRLLGGTTEGVVIGDGTGHWVRKGPRALVAAIGVDPVDADHWLIGAVPGGLWSTADGGDSWRYRPDLPGRVETILPPEGRAE